MYWWSLKNTYLKTSDRLAQEVLMTVGRGIVNDYLACGKKVPEKWLDKKSKLHKEMASDLWGGSNDGNSSSSSVARYLVGEAIPRLWIHQLEESEAQFVKEYLTTSLQLRMPEPNQMSRYRRLMARPPPK